MMEMNSSIINILASIIVFQLSLLIIFLLSSAQGKKLSNRILAGFFLWLLLNLVDAMLGYYGFYKSYPSVAHLEDGLIFLVGPLIYYYTTSMLYRNFTFRKADLIHLLPFVLLTTAFQIYYHFQPATFQKQIQTAITNQNLPSSFYFSIALVYMHVGAYLVASFLEIKHYDRRIREQFSSLIKMKMDWLLFMLIFITTIFAISVTYTFLPVAGLRSLFNATFVVPFLIILIFTNSVVWKTMKQPAIFSGLDYEEEKQKYVGSALTEHDKAALKSKLLHLLEIEKIYLQPDLTVDELAEKAGAAPKKVSQVINESFGQTFFDLINSNRIEEAKRIMRDSTDPKLTVLEVMYRSGFNSKSSFNSIFRRKTGLTPGEFKKGLPS